VTWITDKFPYVITSYLSQCWTESLPEAWVPVEKGALRIGERFTHFQEGGYDAVQVGGAEEVPVREAPGDSQAVGEAHAEGKKLPKKAKKGK